MRPRRSIIVLPSTGQRSGLLFQKRTRRIYRARSGASLIRSSRANTRGSETMPCIEIAAVWAAIPSYAHTLVDVSIGPERVPALEPFAA